MKAALTRKFSLVSDPWLADHAVAGTVCLPASLEVQLCLAVCPPSTRYPVLSLADVRFESPVAFASRATVEVRVYRRRGARGRSAATELRIESGGRVRFRARCQRKPPVEPRCSGLPASEKPSRLAVGPAVIYAALCHGPRMRVLREALRVAPDEAWAWCRRPETDGLQDCACLIEAAFQACGFLALQTGPWRTSVPYSLGAIRVWERTGVLPNPDECAVKVVRQACDRGVDLYHAWVTDLDGRPWVELRGCRMVPHLFSRNSVDAAATLHYVAAEKD